MSWQVAQVANATHIPPSELVAHGGHWFFHLRRVLAASVAETERGMRKAKSRRRGR